MKDHVKLSDSFNNQQIDYSLIFKERFVVAASRLAELLHEPLHQVGILYDSIMKTGQKRKDYLKKDKEVLNSISRMYGKGQMLFLVKHANRSECNRYLSYGYRFAPVHLILDGLVRSLQVSRVELAEYMDNMKLYQISEDTYKSGIYVGFFAIKAHVHHGHVECYRLECLTKSKCYF